MNGASEWLMGIICCPHYYNAAADINGDDNKLIRFEY